MQKRLNLNIKTEYIAYIHMPLAKVFFKVTPYKTTAALRDFVIEKMEDDYQILINTRRDIMDVKDKIRDDFYESAGEWVQEKMRDEIKSCLTPA
ncbi:MAG: hypothetical protein LBQ95_03855 [Lachnospiraceae bacterium]|jgi:hypothetical protein|nr:hypothetical protein [Lachnospiraceae bacterium]